MAGGVSQSAIYPLEVINLLKEFNFMRDIQTWERFLAGSMAGGVSQSAIYPLEVSYLLKAFNF